MNQLATAALKARYTQSVHAARSAVGVHRPGAAAGSAAFVAAVGASERLAAFSAVFEPARANRATEMLRLVLYEYTVLYGNYLLSDCLLYISGSQAFAWRCLPSVVEQ